MATYFTLIPGITTLYLGPKKDEAQAAFDDSSTAGCQTGYIDELGQQKVTQVRKPEGFTGIPIPELRSVQRKAYEFKPR